MSGEPSELEQLAPALAKLPARVLRQVAMVRAMMRHAEEAGSLDMTVENDRSVGPRTWPYIDDLMHRDIASIWSDHPDYRPEWANTPSPDQD